jgi:hypothetical protein
MTFNKGDVVRVGKGKVEYTVTWTPESVGMAPELADPEIQSHNTGKYNRVATSRLTLVKAAEDIARDEKPETDGPLVQGHQPNPTQEALAGYLEGRTPLFSEEEQAVIMRDVDTDDTNEDEAPVKETSAYAKAVLFALNKLDKHVYAGTVRKNVKAQRRSLNLRQKASRKANR